jgi:predicted ABC-type ATPase
MARKRRKPRCVVIAGPNGAGKTTFARDYLLSIAGLIHFVNVDLIAGGISPLRPELAARHRGPPGAARARPFGKREGGFRL